jgi:PhnB protein
MADIDPIPDNYPRVTPYLSVNGAAAALDFYRDVFGATERGDRFIQEDGRIGHAEFQVGDSLIMIADEFPEIDFRSPQSVGGTPVTMHVYVEDVDAVFARAIEAGAIVRREVVNEFYGDRIGQFEDPFGHRWSVASRVESVSPEEMARRAEQGSPELNGDS